MVNIYMSSYLPPDRHRTAAELLPPTINKVNETVHMRPHALQTD